MFAVLQLRKPSLKLLLSLIVSALVGFTGYLWQLKLLTIVDPKPC